MSGANRIWIWAGAIALVLLAGAAWLFYTTRGKPQEATRALADAVDAWRQPVIKRKTEELGKLKKALVADAPAIEAAQLEVNQLRANLEERHAALGLTPEEIAERTKALRV